MFPRWAIGETGGPAAVWLEHASLWTARRCTLLLQILNLLAPS